MNQPLPSKTRRTGLKRMLDAMAINSVGASLTIGQVIFLFALTFNAGDLEMGLLYSAIHLAGVGAILAPLLLGGRGNTTVLARMPDTGALASGLGELKRAVRHVRGSRECFEFVVLTLLMIPMTLAAAYQINFLNNVLALDAATIFFITVAGLVAAAVANRVVRVVGAEVSSRSLLFTVHSLLAVLGLAWSLVEAWPFPFKAHYCAGLYILSTMSLAVAVTVWAGLQAATTPRERGAEVNIVYTFVAVGAAVLGLGAVQGVLRVPWGHTYSAVFVLWTALSALVCVHALRMRSQRGRHFREDLALLAPSNLFTIYRAHRLHRTEGSPGYLPAMEGLMTEATPAGHRLLLEALRSPRVRDRYSALRTLNAVPQPDGFELVLAQALDRRCPLRAEAITCLGFLGNRDAIEPLQPAVRDADLRIRAHAIKSLLRLGHDIPTAEVLEEYRRALSNEPRLHLLVGLVAAGRDGCLYQILSDEFAETGTASSFWLGVVLQMVAAVRDGRERMAELLELEQQCPGDGLDEVLADLSVVVERAEAVSRAAREGRYDELARMIERATGRVGLVARDPGTAVGLLCLWVLAADAR